MAALKREANAELLADLRHAIAPALLPPQDQTVLMQG